MDIVKVNYSGLTLVTAVCVTSRGETVLKWLIQPDSFRLSFRDYSYIVIVFNLNKELQSIKLH